MPTSFNTFEPGVSGMGMWGLPVAAYPGGAILFVNSATGKDARGRVKFPGSSASSVTGGSTQGPIGDPYFPLASIAYALTLCQANRGDVIFVQPYHKELPSTNLVFNVAGVSVIGIPTGLSPAKPIIQPQATGVTVSITADGCVFANINFDGTFVTGITALVTNSGNGTYFFNCRWTMASATNIALVGVSLTGGAGVLFEYCEADSTAAAGATNWLLTATASANHLTMRNCNIRGLFSAAPIADVSGAPLLQMEIGPGNYISQLTSTNVNNITLQSTTSTGIVFGNYFYNARTSLPTAFVGGTNTANLIEANNLCSYAKTGGPLTAAVILTATS